MRIAKTSGLAQRSSIIGRGMIRKMATKAGPNAGNPDAGETTSEAKNGQHAG